MKAKRENAVVQRHLNAYQSYLIEKEKSSATVDKYLRDTQAFFAFLRGAECSKEKVLAYKEHLCARYAPASVNAALSSLGSFFAFLGRQDLRVKNLKIQRRIFEREEKTLTKAEYHRLLEAAKEKKNERLYLLMQTICSTGIRVSELCAITVGAIFCGAAEIACKGKRRQVLLPKQLCRMLKRFVKKQKIKSGPVFVTKKGKPLDRSNIWTEMKKLCKLARVSEKKVFPHNLRHLFARTFYNMQKDIVRLADILGHSNINTTRIYTVETGETHRKQLQMLGLLRC